MGVATGGTRLYRDQLLETLWPHLDPGAAAHNLRTTLYAARRTLAEGAAPGGMLSSQGEHVGLGAEEAVWIDVEAFEAAAAGARRTQHPERYWEALALYGGDLLPEDRYEEWTAVRREELRELYVALHMEVAQLDERRGEHKRAIEALRRVVAAEPAHEGAHAALMRLYALTGQRHHALRQYETLREALRRELDADPDPESRHLYLEILAGPGDAVKPQGCTQRFRGPRPPSP